MESCYFFPSFALLSLTYLPFPAPLCLFPLLPQVQHGEHFELPIGTGAQLVNGFWYILS